MSSNATVYQRQKSFNIQYEDKKTETFIAVLSEQYDW